MLPVQSDSLGEPATIGFADGKPIGVDLGLHR
jgi:hypothetical protein